MLVFILTADRSGEIFAVPSGKIILHGSILREYQLQPQEVQGYLLHVRLFAILRKHRGDDVHDDLELRLVCGSHINEDVFCVQSDFAMLRIDNRGHGENAVVSVINDWINRRISDDVQVTSEMLLGLGGQQGELVGQLFISQFIPRTDS